MKKFIKSLMSNRLKESIYLEKQITDKQYRIIATKDFYNVYCFVFLTLSMFYTVCFEAGTTCQNVFIVKLRNKA